MMVGSTQKLFLIKANNVSSGSLFFSFSRHFYFTYYLQHFRYVSSFRSSFSLWRDALSLNQNKQYGTKKLKRGFACLPKKVDLNLRTLIWHDFIYYTCFWESCWDDFSLWNNLPLWLNSHTFSNNFSRLFIENHVDLLHSNYNFTLLHINKKCYLFEDLKKIKCCVFNENLVFSCSIFRFQTSSTVVQYVKLNMLILCRWTSLHVSKIHK